jgi:hypothetical protein
MNPTNNTGSGGRIMSLNPNNYGTREACQRLAAKGIVMETDCVWVEHLNRVVTKLDYEEHYSGINCIPTVQFTEVWRELPESVKWNDMWHHLTVEKLGDETSCYYRTNGKVSNNTNPTDALIDLLIWVKAQKEEQNNAKV